MSFHGAKNLPSLKRKSQWSTENEPKVDDRAKLVANQKNAIERFNSKKAFHEPKYRKLSFMNRYPRIFMSGFTFISLSLFFSKPLYDAFLREPSAEELERAEFIKARMKAAGWWDNPFAKYLPSLPTAKND